ncbi:dihydropteroate synthase [Algoriphagus sp.]|uniref:dihydropteroate synthase n=1 Tax=Algoriphagus sp. TaxID=1872435 RepID=UPI0025DA24C8|nr:dihydropteroate synthase [Algoriphagus sp.]
MFPVKGVSSFEDRLFPQKYTFQINGQLQVWDSPKIMGILNVTPDSFFGRSRTNITSKDFAEQVGKIISDGADIVDVGGYSSRPGADEVSESEELKRVIPVIEWISKNYPNTLISVDTFRAKVAEISIKSGAHIVNDISSGDLDQDMIPLIGSLKTPYIAMHMRGNPTNMQQLTNYSDILGEILNYFSEKLDQFKKFGIKDVIIDPGFGFAKSIEQNYFLLKNLSQFRCLSTPVLVGVSRKSMIYKTLENNADEALNGTTALNMFSLCQGANILRVHDVKEAKETIKLFNTIYP